MFGVIDSGLYVIRPCIPSGMTMRMFGLSALECEFRFIRLDPLALLYPDNPRTDGAKQNIVLGFRASQRRTDERIFYLLPVGVD